MKILVVCQKFPLLSETFVLQHIVGMIRAGHEVEILARHRGDNRLLGRYGLSERTTYHAASLARKPSRWLAAWFSARRPIRRYDIVHAHFGPAGLWALDLLRSGVISGKLVVSFHGYDLSRELAARPPIRYDSLFDEADLMLPVSQLFGRRLESLGCPTDKIRVHPVAVELSQFRRASYRIQREAFHLVSIARLVEKKGLEYSIDAVASLVRRGLPIRYDIVGQGPLYSRLQARIRRAGMGENIRLRGAKIHYEVRAVLAAADALIAPSVTARDHDQEGIPTVLLEAMACSLPIIASRHSGIPEVIEDGVNGLLVAERDTDALAEAIVRLWQSPELRRQLGAEGRRFVELHRDAAAVNARVVEYYRELCRV